MALVKTTNQSFPIPDELVNLPDDSQEAKNARDERLRRVLAGPVPSITNAQLTFTTEGDQTVITVVPRLGTKAVDARGEAQGISSSVFRTGLFCDFAPVHQLLAHAPAYLPPVLSLAWELKWLEITDQLSFERLLAYQSRIQKVLEAREGSRLVGQIHEQLKRLPPRKSPAAPIGF